MTADPSPVTVTVSVDAPAAAAEAPAVPAPAPLAAIPSTTKAPTTGAKPEPTRGGGGSYKNCSEARAAGAAPVHVGDPGYGSHLDRDGDGVGCE
ncbi:excalibur calcium-binding domain-containing protein [Nakamurella flava]|uniref:Excalibur calcium-binding domain-containing protein n=1 Tax=Nakamurella flava TaxID=2576308 RepID=A0A4U6QPQ4_9ACTN|nr:excalibur calcium-binding domain-containing protein [Nakamurella flava]